MTRPRNEAGPHRAVSTAEPIDPAKTYPIRALHQWGFGARSLAAMQRNGLRVLRYSKWKFVRGQDLIDFLERAAVGVTERHGDIDRTRKFDE